jgi:precorrin-6B methylase 2
MRTTLAPATEPRDLSEIAYGFMASKALFAALEVDLFSCLAQGPRTSAALAAKTGVAPTRLRTLLGALAGLGLVRCEGQLYANAPASQRYLVRGAPGDYGDYFRLQLGRQVYPALMYLDAGIGGTDHDPDTDPAPGTGSDPAFDSLDALMSDPDQARTFTVAQHAGSGAAARVLAERLPLDHAERLLDVGGGSGAFSIALCRRNPNLHATVLDFAPVLDVARSYRDEAGLGARINLLPGDAVHTGWPQQQDVVLLSYLLSCLGDAEIDLTLAKAHACLRPGGLLVVHDFMLDDAGPGPTMAALWFLQYLAYRSDAVSFSAGDLGDRLRTASFAPRAGDVLIPEITKVVLARKVDPQ